MTTPPKPERTLTGYLILKETGGEKVGYEIVAPLIRAASADAALRGYFDQNVGATGGTFIAIPARSWRPVQVKVETQTVVKLDQPTS